VSERGEAPPRTLSPLEEKKVKGELKRGEASKYVIRSPLEYREF